MDTVEEPLKARQISYSKWIDSAVYHSSPESLVSMESAELVSPGSAQKKLNSVSLRLGSSWRNTLNKTCGSLLCYFHQFKESTEHCHNSQQLIFNKLKTLPLMCMYNMYMFPRNNAPEQSAWWSQSAGTNESVTRSQAHCTMDTQNQGVGQKEWAQLCPPINGLWRQMFPILKDVHPKGKSLNIIFCLLLFLSGS